MTSLMIIVMLLSFSLGVTAEEIELTFTQLMDLYENQSIDNYQTELSLLLDEIQDEANLEKYENTLDSLSIQEAKLYMYEIELEQHIEEEDTSSPEFYQVIYQLALTQHQYLNTLEGQLDTYMDMEVLQYELDRINQVLNQELITNQYDFQAYLYDYGLLQLDYELSELEQEILIFKKENALVELEQGVVTTSFIEDLDKQLLALKDQLVTSEIKLKEYYDTILYTLDLDSSLSYDFDINLFEIEILDIQKMDEFLDLATSTNFRLNLIEFQQQQYENYLEKLNSVYDEDEPSYEENYLSYQLSLMSLEQEKQSIYLDLKKCYYNYDNSIKEVDLSYKKYALYEQNYKNILQEFEIGNVSTLNQLEAEYQYKKNTYNYYQQLVSYDQFKVDYLKYLYGIN